MTRRIASLTRSAALVLCLLGANGCGSDTRVYPGIDVLAADQFATLDGQRVALITNHTGLARGGRSTIELLNAADNVDLVRLFSPEHGPDGTLDIEQIDDGADASTGIEIISLYGEVRRPTAEMLAGIDTVVFDIQDIGARFYTYISTLGYAMQAAAEHDVAVVVLDRPNPINGINVAGPMLDAGRESFVGFHQLPVRHGMTVGELALLFYTDLELELDLHIVPVQGWQRDQFFDVTGLPWVNPSPNIRSLDAALLYPGIGLLETTNLSVGRGTDIPFSLLGAPWINGDAMATALRARQIPGVSIEPDRFTPESSRFANETCSGIRMAVTDRARFDPLQLGFEIARYLVMEHANEWEGEAALRLLGNEATLNAMLLGNDFAALREIYGPDLNTFIERRQQFLLY